jgi:hypothetical protein
MYMSTSSGSLWVGNIHFIVGLTRWEKKVVSSRGRSTLLYENSLLHFFGYNYTVSEACETGVWLTAGSKVCQPALPGLRIDGMAYKKRIGRDGFLAPLIG